MNISGHLRRCYIISHSEARSGSHMPSVPPPEITCRRYFGADPLMQQSVLAGILFGEALPSSENAKPVILEFQAKATDRMSINCCGNGFVSRTSVCLEANSQVTLQTLTSPKRFSSYMFAYDPYRQICNMA